MSSVKLVSRLRKGITWERRMGCFEASSWESQGQGDANRVDNFVEPLRLF